MRIALIVGSAGVAFAAVTAAPRAAAPLVLPGQGAMPARAASAFDPLPGEGFRDVRVLRYTMAGRIRPLLFWIGRDDIGFARVIWREGDLGARAYELLVGTDPVKAPRSLNRWGYIAEEVAGGNGAVLALMTGSDEASYDEASANAAHAAASGRDFRAIRSQLHGSTATWQTARVETSADFTVHDVDAALERVRHETASAARREQKAPAGSRSGFLVALAELIDSGAGATARGGKPSGEPVPYVFGQSAYELRLRSTQAGSVLIDGQPTPVVRSSFEIRTITTDARTRFDVSFGSSGRLVNVPVAVEWQPRWWLKVELRLETTLPRS